VADIHVVRDVLDKQLLDRRHCKMGRVDGIVLHVPDDGPPRIVRLETGGSAIWRRLHPGLERVANAIRRHIGPESNAPSRIAWEQVVTLGKNVVVDFDARRAQALAWERWLATHVLAHIPGCTAGEDRASGKKGG